MFTKKLITYKINDPVVDNEKNNIRLEREHFLNVCLWYETESVMHAQQETMIVICYVKNIFYKHRDNRGNTSWKTMAGQPYQQGCQPTCLHQSTMYYL